MKLFTIKKLSGRDVQLQLGFCWTGANFGWPMSNDRLLLAVLLIPTIPSFVPETTNIIFKFLLIQITVYLSLLAN